MYCEIFKGLFWFNFDDCVAVAVLRVYYFLTLLQLRFTAHEFLGPPILRTLPLVCESAETHQRLDVDLHGDVVATEIGQEAET